MADDDLQATSLDEDIRLKLNRETSKIHWHELQKFYAKGAVVAVKKGMDLIDVAVQFSDDNKAQVESWLAAGCVGLVNDQQAQQWYQENTLLWAVVVAPWVLVQAIEESLDDRS